MEADASVPPRPSLAADRDRFWGLGVATKLMARTVFVDLVVFFFM
jgi:hypothetical protein